MEGNHGNNKRSLKEEKFINATNSKIMVNIYAHLCTKDQNCKKSGLIFSYMYLGKININKSYAQCCVANKYNILLTLCRINSHFRQLRYIVFLHVKKEPRL